VRLRAGVEEYDEQDAGEQKQQAGRVVPSECKTHGSRQGDQGRGKTRLQIVPIVLPAGADDGTSVVIGLKSF
jgi:hypothetical protein